MCIRDRSIADIKVLDNNDNSSNTDSKEKSINTEDIKKDLEVYIPSLNTSGIIVSNLSKDNTVQVQIGSMKMNLEISKLQKLQKLTPSTSSISSNTGQKSGKNNLNGSYTKISKTRTVKSEINVIGQNVEEATFVIDKFLDDSSLAKLQTVRIVPVSYTHLDVYKRQALKFLLFHLHLHHIKKHKQVSLLPFYILLLLEYLKLYIHYSSL